MARKSMAGNSNYKESATKAQIRKLTSKQSIQNINTNRQNLGRVLKVSEIAENIRVDKFSVTL